MKELLNRTDIELLVNQFYAVVQKDELLGPVFHQKLNGRWPEHLEKMYRFWETILLDQKTYSGSPFPPHAKLPIDQVHFDRWLQLFTGMVDKHFTGEKASEAKWRAQRMAELFNFKIEHYKQHPEKSPLL